MFGRRNSLRNSQRRNSGVNPAAAAAVVSFNQQNPRQNHTALAAGAAAEALRRHSLDAQGAQMVANFRRNSLSSQTGRTNSITSQTGRTGSLTRRNSLRTTSTVNRDQYGRAMSLTTTTVRQMGSFELVKQEESAVRRPRHQQYHAESLYSLESLAEEPEYQDHGSEPRYESHHRGGSHRGRVSFLDDTSEFHYDSYNTSESSALAAAAAAAPQQYLRAPGPAPVNHKPRSPIKSALKKSSVHSPINYAELEEPPTIYEDEEYEDNANYETKNRPISAASQFSTVTAKSHFSDEDRDQNSLASPASTRDGNENNEHGEVEDETLTQQTLAHEHYSESDDSVYLDNEAVAEPQTPGNSEAPSLAKANVSPIKRGEEGQMPHIETRQSSHSPKGPRSQSRTQAPPPNGAVVNGRQQSSMPRQAAPNGRVGFRTQPNGRMPAPRDQYTQQRAPIQQRPPPPQQQAQRNQLPRQYGYSQHQQQPQQQPQQQITGSNSLRSESYRPTRLSMNVGQQNGFRQSQSPQNRQSFIQAPRRQLQPSPSIDSFNRIGNTNDILQKARDRARLMVNEQQPNSMPAPTRVHQNIDDDVASVNSDSSWKRSTPITRSNFGTNSMELSPAGLRPPSVSSSQYGVSRNRMPSPANGRTFSLRGAAPPSIGRNFKSRFDDSDDEDAAAYAPTALPQLSSQESTSAGTPRKKKGFFKRLFSSKH